MSRTSETIEEVINEVVFKPTPTIELVSDRIVKKLLERHPYTSKAEVKLEGKIIVQLRENRFHQEINPYGNNFLQYHPYNGLG